MKTLVVAKYTFLEVLRSKIFVGVLFLALAILFVSYVASEFAYGGPTKVSLDFGLGLMSVSNIIISIFLGVTLISKEIETKTLYMVLSKPISRSSFLMGKVLGLTSVILTNTVLLVSISSLLYCFLGGTFQNLIVWVGVFSVLESLVLMGIAILFSLVTSLTLSVFFTLVYIVSAYSINETAKIFFAKANVLILSILKFFDFIIIDLQRINFKDHLIYSADVSPQFIYLGLAYVISYIVVLYFIVSLIFKNKNLD